MAQVHSKSLTRKTGGTRHAARKKKLRELGRDWIPLTVAEEVKRKDIRKRGGSKKQVLTRAAEINLATKDGKVVKTKINTVLENSANPHFVRRNIMTKGAIVETEKGKVRITSKPGSDGVLNGVLVE